MSESSRAKSIHQVLHRTLTNCTKERKRGSLNFSSSLPYLTNKEFLVVKHICTTSLRPVLFMSKKTNEFSPLDGLLIPSDYVHYESIVGQKQNFSRIKKSLIFKRILFETEYGFMLNHHMIPFTSKNTMSYLYRISSIPLAPSSK